MFSLKTWKKARHDKKVHEAYDRGFLWSLSAFFLEKKELGYIEAHIWHAPMITDPPEERAFDNGAAAALRILVENFDDGTTVYMKNLESV